MAKGPRRRIFFSQAGRIGPAIAEHAEEMMAEEEAGPRAAPPPAPPSHAEREWWVEAADGRRWRLIT